MHHEGVVIPLAIEKPMLQNGIPREILLSKKSQCLFVLHIDNCVDLMKMKNPTTILNGFPESSRSQPLMAIATLDDDSDLCP